MNFEIVAYLMVGIVLYEILITLFAALNKESGNFLKALIPFEKQINDFPLTELTYGNYVPSENQYCHEIYSFPGSKEGCYCEFKFEGKKTSSVYNCKCTELENTNNCNVISAKEEIPMKIN